MGTVALARCGGRPLGAHLFSVWPGAAFAASVFPVRCAPGDNLALHVAVEQAPPGSALAVDVAGETEYGYVDEILAVAAHTRGIEGIVLDGCVRDIAAIARCELPVFSAGVSVREAGHHAGGSVGQAITMSATGPVPLQARRGDWIAADDDGVVLLPRGQVSSIIGKTVDSLSHEQELIEAVHAGQSTLDLLGLDPSQVSGWEGAGEHRQRRGVRPGGPPHEGAVHGEARTQLRSCNPPHTSVGEGRRRD
ncbi:RraA family protein [Nocardiopsis xinjiangensis]|uniref:RraA family protein n=1 Tax=Nocardiopsis xinjiangensis TaxID=124285 RepID=UPI000347486F|nr:hypothetical protein [Nocardiopsis xinjiangensis]